MPTDPRTFVFQRQFSPTADLREFDPQGVQTRFEPDFARVGHGRMNAIAVGDLAIVDEQQAAIIGAEVERVLAGAIDLEEAFKADGVVVPPTGDLELEAATFPLLHRLELREVGNAGEIAMVNGVLEVGILGADLNWADEVVGQVAGLLRVVGQPGHAARRAGLVRVFEESREAGNGVFGGQVAQRDGGRGGHGRPFARGVAGDAAERVVQPPATVGGLGIGAPLGGSAGGSQEVGQRQGGLVAGLLRKRAEQVGHGGPGLGAMWVGEELHEPLGAGPQTNLRQHRTGAGDESAGQFFPGGVAGGAAQFIQQVPTWLEWITTGLTNQPLERGDHRVAGLGGQVAGQDPNVAIADGVAVVLQVNRSGVRAFLVGGGGRDTGEFDLFVHHHAIQLDGDPGVGQLFAGVIVTGGGEVGVVGLPHERGQAHVQVGLADGVQSAALVVFPLEAKRVEHLGLVPTLVVQATVAPALATGGGHVREAKLEVDGEVLEGLDAGGSLLEQPLRSAGSLFPVLLKGRLGAIKEDNRLGRGLEPQCRAAAFDLLELEVGDFLADARGVFVGILFLGPIPAGAGQAATVGHHQELPGSLRHHLHTEVFTGVFPLQGEVGVGGGFLGGEEPRLQIIGGAGRLRGDRQADESPAKETQQNPGQTPTDQTRHERTSAKCGNRPRGTGGEEGPQATIRPRTGRHRSPTSPIMERSGIEHNRPPGVGGVAGGAGRSCVGDSRGEVLGRRASAEELGRAEKLRPRSRTGRGPQAAVWRSEGTVSDQNPGGHEGASPGGESRSSRGVEGEWGRTTGQETTGHEATGHEAIGTKPIAPCRRESRRRRSLRASAFPKRSESRASSASSDWSTSERTRSGKPRIWTTILPLRPSPPLGPLTSSSQRRISSTCWSKRSTAAWRLRATRSSRWSPGIRRE